MSLKGMVSLPLDAVPYAVIDVETTGFSPRRGDRVVEIALVRMTPDTFVNLFAPLEQHGSLRT
jgi:DNA polymerase III epsilon subunit-like protein